MTVLLVVIAVLPLVQCLVGWAVLRAPSDAPVSVDVEVLRAMRAREQRRALRRLRLGTFDEARTNRRRP